MNTCFTNGQPVNENLNPLGYITVNADGPPVSRPYLSSQSVWGCSQPSAQTSISTSHTSQRPERLAHNSRLNRDSSFAALEESPFLPD